MVTLNGVCDMFTTRDVEFLNNSINTEGSECIQKERRYQGILQKPLLEGKQTTPWTIKTMHVICNARRVTSSQDSSVGLEIKATVVSRCSNDFIDRIKC